MKFLAKVSGGYLKPLQRIRIPEETIVELEINTRKWFEEITKRTDGLLKLPGKYFPDYLIDKIYIEYLHIVKRVKSSREECRDAIALFFACRRLGIPCKIKKVSYRSFKKLLGESPPFFLTHYLDFVLKSLNLTNVLKEEEIVDALKKVGDNKGLSTLGAVLYLLANKKGVPLTQKVISEVLVITPTGLRKKIREIESKL